jgi:hypothetical protein
MQVHLRRQNRQKRTLRTDLVIFNSSRCRLSPSMRRPVRVKTFLFLLLWILCLRAEPPLSPSFHPQSVMSDCSLAARWAYSIQSVLLPDYRPRLQSVGREMGQDFGAVTGSRRLSSAVPIRLCFFLSLLPSVLPLLLFSFFLPFPVFHRDISRQDRLGTTIATSVDP